MIAPRPVEWMLRHREQFEVSKAEFYSIRDQRFGQLLPVAEVAVFIALPGTEMNFVDRYRGIEFTGGWRLCAWSRIG